MIIKHSIKRYSAVEIVLILLLLLLVFGLLNPLAANAQDAEYDAALTHEDELEQQPMEAVHSNDNGVMSKARALRKLVFSFLASTTGLSSLFWIVVTGGFKL